MTHTIMRIKMIDFRTLTVVPFGWPQVFLFYISFLLVFLIIRKLMNYLIKKKTSVLDFIYILIIMATGGAYLTIFIFGEKFIIGHIFISQGGNKDIIIWSSLLFVFILAVFSSPNIKK